jgi:hypothetical protein
MNANNKGKKGLRLRGAKSQRTVFLAVEGTGLLSEKKGGCLHILGAKLE